MARLRMLIQALILTAASCGAVVADVPDSPFTSLGRGFVDGVNAGSAQIRVKLTREIYSAASLEQIGEARLIELFVRLRAEMGELRFHHVEPTGKYLHVFAQSLKDSQWHDFQFEMAPEVPPRLSKIFFIAEVAEPVYLPNGDIDHPHTLDWLNQYIDTLAAENDFAGAILLARGGGIFFERYVGFADLERTRRIGPDTRMNLGSGNKMFTALAAMQLRDQGRLALTDTLARFFPDYPNQAFIATATVGQLLSHTSGLGDFFDRMDEIAKRRIDRLEQMLPYVYDDSIAFTPGTGFQYSNCGFILAGLLVEKLSGKDYFEYVRQNICLPLGLSNTDSYEMTGSDRTLADPLARSDSGWVRAAHGRRGSSAGGGFSTPRDIFEFARGLKAGTIVSQSTLDEMTQPHNAGLEDSYPYGYGFGLTMRRGKLESYGHGGQAPGVNFEFKYFPAEDLTLVIFCNQDNGAFDDLRKNVTKLITGDR